MAKFETDFADPEIRGKADAILNVEAAFDLPGRYRFTLEAALEVAASGKRYIPLAAQLQTLLSGRENPPAHGVRLPSAKRGLGPMGVIIQDFITRNPRGSFRQLLALFRRLENIDAIASVTDEFVEYSHHGIIKKTNTSTLRSALSRARHKRS